MEKEGLEPPMRAARLFYRQVAVPVGVLSKCQKN